MGCIGAPFNFEKIDAYRSPLIRYEKYSISSETHGKKSRSKLLCASWLHPPYPSFICNKNMNHRLFRTLYKHHLLTKSQEFTYIYLTYFKGQRSHPRDVWSQIKAQENPLFGGTYMKV